jgi:hypothetical protein
MNNDGPTPPRSPRKTVKIGETVRIIVKRGKDEICTKYDEMNEREKEKQVNVRKLSGRQMRRDLERKKENVDIERINKLVKEIEELKVRKEEPKKEDIDMCMERMMGMSKEEFNKLTKEEQQNIALDIITAVGIMQGQPLG